MQIYIWVQKSVSYTIYNTDLGANSIKNPINDFVNNRLLRPAWIAFLGLGMEGSCCANKHKSIPHEGF